MKILALCDSPTMTTGFGRVAQNLFRRWNKAGVLIDCWAIGFRGWKYRQAPYVNELFPAGGGGEWGRMDNLEIFCQQLQRGGYTHLWMLQDTFMLSQFRFPECIKRVCDQLGVVSCLYFPVDAPLEPQWTEIIQAVDIPVAYTHYGQAQAVKASLQYRAEASEDAQHFREAVPNWSGQVQVLPHGVDRKVYKPLADRAEVRRKYWLVKEGEKPWVGDGDLLMVNVNANQRRKDVSRSLEVLAGLLQRGVPAKLVMHMPPLSGEGVDLTLVARQLGLVIGKDWGHHGQFFNGSISSMSEEDLARLYGIADLYLTTSHGEGWGLGITEALGCGTPVAVPAHTSCFEIWNTLRQCKVPVEQQPVLLETEPHAVVLDWDNSRRRPRVDVDFAVDAIERRWKSGGFPRVTLTPEALDWLSWDRVAREFLRLMRGVKKEKAPSGAATL